VTVHVEVEVANYYPSIASGISGRVYKLTQSWVHVLITARVPALARAPGPGGVEGRALRRHLGGVSELR